MTIAIKTVDPSAVLRDAIAALDTPGAEAMLPAVEQALRQVPNDFRLWHVHGLILRKLDRREEAIMSLRKAHKLGPHEPKIAHGLARTLLEAGLPSLEAYGEALRLSPGDPDVILGLTSALVAEGRTADAVAGLERIMDRSPLWVDGHALISRLRWTLGEREGFARSFDQAIARHQGELGLRREHIRTLTHAEHFDEVLKVIAEGRAALGDQPLFAANEAIVHAELGHTEKADILFDRLLEFDDSSVAVRQARHFLRSGRPERAAAIIEPWLERPEAFMFWPYVSIAWRMTEDPRWEWLEGDERFVGVYDIADRLPPLDQLAETLRRLHTLTGQPLEQSVRGGTQTDGNLFAHIDPVIVALREAIRSTVAEHAANLPPRDPSHPLLRPPRAPIAFSGAWSVRLKSGGKHSNHVHPMGWLSSALYIALPPDLGEGQAGWLTLGESRAPNFDIDLPPFRTVEPKPGRLVLFPSTTWHGTRPFQVGERLTVAFDVAMPR